MGNNEEIRRLQEEAEKARKEAAANARRIAEVTELARRESYEMNKALASEARAATRASELAADLANQQLSEQRAYQREQNRKLKLSQSAQDLRADWRREFLHDYNKASKNKGFGENESSELSSPKVELAWVEYVNSRIQKIETKRKELNLSLAEFRSKLTSSVATKNQNTSVIDKQINQLKLKMPRALSEKAGKAVAAVIAVILVVLLFKHGHGIINMFLGLVIGVPIATFILWAGIDYLSKLIADKSIKSEIYLEQRKAISSLENERSNLVNAHGEYEQVIKQNIQERLSYLNNIPSEEVLKELRRII